jgi:hypothetical protein
VTGLLVAAGLDNPYDLVLFVHLCALLAAIASGAIAHLSEARLRAAVTLPEIRSPFSVLTRVEKMFPIALALLVATGGYLVHRRWTWDSGWVEASLGAVAALLLNGALVVKSRTRAIRRELRTTSGNRATAALLELSRHHIAGIASWLNTGLALGIVFVMTNKPSLEASVAALLVAASAGATVGVSLRRTGAGNG